MHLGGVFRIVRCGIGAEMAQTTANVGAFFWGFSESVSWPIFLTGFVHVFFPLCINVINDFLNFVGRAGQHASTAYSRMLFPRSGGGLLSKTKLGDLGDT